MAPVSAQTYAARARKHWAQWLPKKVAALREAGELESTLQTVGRRANDQVLELMGQGFKQHEAEEVALAEHVLLPPESDAAMPAWERQELATLERQHRGKSA